ncbi:MAG: NAD(P)-binding domain-containing protein [Propionibacteriaceae bacterium]|nr:NAD(P)-binding domain-containing protein [Propionibacteriaceae bacterium]
MVTVTILGAGGAMGRRITRSLIKLEGYDLRFVEPGERGRQLMADEFGTGATPLDEALTGTDVVVLAVPDRIVGPIAEDLVPQMEPGCCLLSLDPAAAHAHRVPRREDISYFVMHPTHPPLYDLLKEEDPKARLDFWGGGLAHQALVWAKAWGEEAKAEMIHQLCRDMFAPISRSHRITVDQMALLEPAMSESVTNACLELMKQARERVKDAGVPGEAVDDFFMGHLQIAISLIFDQLDWKLSEGAVKAAHEAQSILFKEDWYRILDPAEVQRSTKSITGG